MKKLIITLIAGLATVSAAQAQQAYVGAAVSASDTRYSISNNGTDSAYKGSGKLFGGWELNDQFGIEAGYTDLHDTDGSYNIGGATGRITTGGSRSYLAGKASWPLSQQASLYGKLGVGYSKFEVSGNLPQANWDDSKTEAYGALGAQYKLNQNVSLIAEYERYGKKKDFGAKADAFTIGAKYAF